MEVHEWNRKEKSLNREEFASLFSEERSREYLRALRQVSQDIGAFVERLLALPGWQDTLFIITSDHGEGLNSHPDIPESKYHGRLLYESQIMIPLIFYHPKRSLVAKPIDRPVRLLDIMPT